MPILTSTPKPHIKETAVEMFYSNSNLNFGIPPVLVFKLEVYFKVDRLLTGLSSSKRNNCSMYQIKHLYLNLNKKYSLLRDA